MGKRDSVIPRRVDLEQRVCLHNRLHLREQIDHRASRIPIRHLQQIDVRQRLHETALERGAHRPMGKTVPGSGDGRRATTADRRDNPVQSSAIPGISLDSLRVQMRVPWEARDLDRPLIEIVVNRLDEHAVILQDVSSASRFVLTCLFPSQQGDHLVREDLEGRGVVAEDLVGHAHNHVVLHALV